MGVENAPYGKLFEQVQAMVFPPAHPYAHTTIGIDALENGLHVLVEKPLSVHKADCDQNPGGLFTHLAGWSHKY